MIQKNITKYRPLQLRRGQFMHRPARGKICCCRSTRVAQRVGEIRPTRFAKIGGFLFAPGQMAKSTHYSILLWPHSIEAQKRITERPSHMICPGVQHSTTHDSILPADLKTLHHLRLLRSRYFDYSATQRICKFVPFYRRR